jgi:hypothetical protein
MTKQVGGRALCSVARCVVVATLLGLAMPAGAAGPLSVQLDNGVAATVYPPDYVLDHMTLTRGDETLFVVDDIQYQFVTDIADPVVANKGDGRFHPMPLDDVVAALGAVRFADVTLPVRVFVLPYPRREVLDSSARADLIMLTPGVREISDSTIHFTVTHELGHIFQYRWMPDEDLEAWDDYNALRGIEDSSVYNAGAIHRNRPHEVFAEDFRFLFGGSLSTSSGTIENPDLALPSNVPGLEEFILALPDARRATAAQIVPTPNPFNPSTEIRVEFEGRARDRDVQLRVFDAQGRQVRHLYHDVLRVNQLRVPWDGRNENGRRAASGVYFTRLDYDGHSTTKKLTLLK